MSAVPLICEKYGQNPFENRILETIAIIYTGRYYHTVLPIINKEDKYQCKIHAYCMMTNHIHLLLETSEDEIGRFMKCLSERYAMYFNHKYQYRGHLFESRYKSCLVKEDSYFLQTSRYIHLNPVKARIVVKPEDYRWSSYQTMIALKDDRITERNRTLAYFKDNSILRYRDFVEDIGHKYVVQEHEIKKSMEELPFD